MKPRRPIKLNIRNENQLRLVYLLKKSTDNYNCLCIINAKMTNAYTPTTWYTELVYGIRHTGPARGLYRSIQENQPIAQIAARHKSFTQMVNKNGARGN